MTARLPSAPIMVALLKDTAGLPVLTGGRTAVGVELPKETADGRFVRVKESGVNVGSFTVNASEMNPAEAVRFHIDCYGSPTHEGHAEAANLAADVGAAIECAAGYQYQAPSGSAYIRRGSLDNRFWAPEADGDRARIILMVRLWIRTISNDM